MRLSFAHLGDLPVCWLPAAHERPVSPFSASWYETRLLLDSETAVRGGASAVVHIAFAHPDEVFDSTWAPKERLPETVETTHPGVLLTLETDTGECLVFQCDRFAAQPGSEDRSQPPHPAWQENLRYIALELQAAHHLERTHGGIFQPWLKTTPVANIGPVIALRHMVASQNPLVA